MRWILMCLCLTPGLLCAEYVSEYQRNQAIEELNARLNKEQPKFSVGRFTLRVTPAIIGFAAGYQAGWVGNTNFSMYRANEERFQTALIGVVGAELVCGIFNAVFRIEKYKLGILAGVNSEPYNSYKETK